VGKLSFEESALVENVQAFLSQIRAMRASACRAQYIRQAFLSGTMTPSVRLQVE